jgi:chemotaxis protein methyltransferase CheR
MSSRPTLANHASERERSVQDPSLVLIRDLIYRTSGIVQPDNKLYFLKDRCGRRMRAVGAESTAEYFGLLTNHSECDSEVRRLLNEITVGETCFFRNEPQLNAIRKIVLPKLTRAERKKPCVQLKIWSCGCSTGEEPYTLAMILLEESLSLLKGYDWQVIATDINDRSLAAATEGIYDAYSLRNVATGFRNKYFQKRGAGFLVSKGVKDRVKFGRLNLLDDEKIGLVKNNDIIMCANVLIYFDPVSKRRTVEHFFNNLLPDGHLFLGHSESLYGVSNDFRLVHFPGATAYAKSDPTISKATPKSLI